MRITGKVVVVDQVFGGSLKLDVRSLRIECVVCRDKANAMLVIPILDLSPSCDITRTRCRYYDFFELAHQAVGHVL